MTIDQKAMALDALKAACAETTKEHGDTGRQSRELLVFIAKIEVLVEGKEASRDFH